MQTLDQVKNKVQRLITTGYGDIRIDKDGDFIVKYESATVFVRVDENGEGEDKSYFLVFTCPMVKDVEINDDLCRFLALECNYRFGHVELIPNKDSKVGWLYFVNTIMADDLDESEFKGGLLSVVFTAAELDTNLQQKFGGVLFGED